MTTTSTAGRVRLSAAALVLAPALVLTGCGHKDSTSATGSSTAQSQSADESQESVPEDPDMDSTCPATSQGHFDKATFVLHSGLAIGAAKHWIITPARNGSFAKGADGRVKAFVKAGAAALFVKHEIGEAHKDVKQDPQLCGLIEKPMADLGNTIKGAVDKAKSGDLSGVDSLEGLTSQIMSGADSKGAHITPDESADISGHGKK